MPKFTVILMYEESGQVCADEVTAKNGEEALLKVAQDPDRNGCSLILAIQGKTDGKLTFAGEGVVDAENYIEEMKEAQPIDFMITCA